VSKKERKFLVRVIGEDFFKEDDVEVSASTHVVAKMRAEAMFEKRWPGHSDRKSSKVLSIDGERVEKKAEQRCSICGCGIHDDESIVKGMCPACRNTGVDAHLVLGKYTPIMTTKIVSWDPSLTFVPQGSS